MKSTLGLPLGAHEKPECDKVIAAVPAAMVLRNSERVIILVFTLSLDNSIQRCG
jgi:hypothetical protein